MRVRKPPADVSEIWVITTEPGKRTVERTLLDPRHGRFFAFCRDHRLGTDRLRFGPENVVAIPGQDGRSLEDIRTAEDSAAAADFILDFIRNLASDSSHVLHCSVAGGRKTMGYYLGLALQLYGRATDTLSHVLVSPSELEGDPAFYYPDRNG
jgi:CRISPR-associated protein (TIGR02584 family)